MNLIERIEEHSGFDVLHDRFMGIDRITGEFWPARQRSGHSLHEISYRACYRPELPSFIMQILPDNHMPILDPFGGRGTTVLETCLKGRTGINNDINPISALLCRPRTHPPTLNQVKDWLEAHPLGDDVSSSTQSIFDCIRPQFPIYVLNSGKIDFKILLTPEA